MVCDSDLVYCKLNEIIMNNGCDLSIDFLIKMMNGMKKLLSMYCLSNKC